MRENTANNSYNNRLTSWVDRLLPFDFTIDRLPGSKMGLVDYNSRDPQQKAVNISAYDEKFIVANLALIQRSAKRFLLNAENYTDFEARNPLTKRDSNSKKGRIPLTHYAANLHREIENILILRKDTI